MPTEALAHKKAPAKRLDRRWQGPFRVLWCPLEDSNLRFRPEKSASLAARRRGRAYTNTPFPQVGWAATEWARAEVVLRGVYVGAGERRQASGDAGFRLKRAGARADVRLRRCVGEGLAVGLGSRLWRRVRLSTPPGGLFIEAVDLAYYDRMR